MLYVILLCIDINSIKYTNFSINFINSFPKLRIITYYIYIYVCNFIYIIKMLFQ